MKRFIKFACVGGISFFINLGITYGLKELWLDYRIAMAKYASISLPLDALAYGLAILLRESVLAEYYYGYLVASAIGIFVIFIIRFLFVSKYIWKVPNAV
jgi:putative flippase GtrA